MDEKNYTVPYAVPTPNNMGIVRYILAFSVVIAHFKVLTGCDFFFPISSYTGVGGFFALSGFLIYGSYLRKQDVKTYLISRARRILPAYWITVLFFAIVLAGVSTLSPGAYFGSGEFWRYLVSNLAFANFLQPTLPGVFDTLSQPAVNGSLWTMKVEWCLYITPPIVVWLIYKLRTSPMKMFAAIFLLSCAIRVILLYQYSITGSETYYILSRQFFGQLAYFYVGVMCYYSFDLMMRHRIATLLVALSALALSAYVPYGRYVLHPLGMSVLVIWVSMVGKWGTWEGKRDNISYNIYLIHFPVIQLYAFVRGNQQWNTAAGLAICIGVTWVLSWLLGLAEKRIRQYLAG